MAKRNKEPQNTKVMKRLQGMDPERWWVICIVCGDYCPQAAEGYFAQYDTVHVTCTYDWEYPRLAKKLERERAEAGALSLF